MAQSWCSDDSFFVVHFESDDTIQCLGKEDVEFITDDLRGDDWGRIRAFFDTVELDHDGNDVIRKKDYSGTIVLSGERSTCVTFIRKNVPRNMTGDALLCHLKEKAHVKKLSGGKRGASVVLNTVLQEMRDESNEASKKKRCGKEGPSQSDSSEVSGKKQALAKKNLHPSKLAEVSMFMAHPLPLTPVFPEVQIRLSPRAVTRRVENSEVFTPPQFRGFPNPSSQQGLRTPLPLPLPDMAASKGQWATPNKGCEPYLYHTSQPQQRLIHSTPFTQGIQPDELSKTMAPPLYSPQASWPIESHLRPRRLEMHQGLNGAGIAHCEQDTEHEDMSSVLRGSMESSFGDYGPGTTETVDRPPIDKDDNMVESLTAYWDTMDSRQQVAVEHCLELALQWIKRRRTGATETVFPDPNPNPGPSTATASEIVIKAST
ncbi:uncharacterized protein [Ambystoma mexicanum]|uniref:uncharacterized protein n=1 Tax=Ambystoma mexicanum TaxID=8296 RepID=UPI0037E81DC8